MFINCPNVLLQVGFVQSLVCCDLILEYVSRFTELNLLAEQFGSWIWRAAISLLKRYLKC